MGSALNEDEGNVLHYVCNSDGENPGWSDMRIFDIEYTVADSAYVQQQVKDKRISEA